MFFALCEEQIPEQVAQSVLWEGANDLLRERLIEQLTDRLHTAVLGTPERPSHFDPRHNGSPVGWAWSYLATAARGIAQQEQQHLSDYHQEISERAHAITFSATPDGGWGNDQVSALNMRLKHHTGLGRRLEGARGLHDAFGIPDLTPPSSPVICRELWSRIGAHPEILETSLRAAATGRPSDTDLDRLWLQFTPNDALALLDRDKRIALLVTEAALSPIPRPGERLLLAHRKLVKAASSQRGWPSLAGRVQQAWLAHFFADRADRDTTVPASAPETAPSWEGTATEAAAFRGAPLGPTSSEVHTTLMRLLDAAKEPS
ncbi:hypothetical protein ACXR2T_07625 [Leucobacter sp. HY1910]